MSTTNILDLNNRIDELEKNSGGGSADSAKRSDIATEFSTETSYTAGNFVYHDGKLYQFNADHSAGAWNPTDVVEANVTDQIVSNKAAIDGLTASDVAYDNTDSGLTATNVQNAVDELSESYPADKVILSDGVTSVEDALDAVMPRTASGTTAAQLTTALSALTAEQKALCAFAVNGNDIILRQGQTAVQYGSFSVTSAGIKEYRYNTILSKFYEYTWTTSRAEQEIAVTSWTLYYQGTPIS